MDPSMSAATLTDKRVSFWVRRGDTRTVQQGAVVGELGAHWLMVQVRPGVRVDVRRTSLIDFDNELRS